VFLLAWIKRRLAGKARFNKVSCILCNRHVRSHRSFGFDSHTTQVSWFLLEVRPQWHCSRRNSWQVYGMVQSFFWSEQCCLIVCHMHWWYTIMFLAFSAPCMSFFDTSVACLNSLFMANGCIMEGRENPLMLTPAQLAERQTKNLRYERTAMIFHTDILWSNVFVF